MTKKTSHNNKIFTFTNDNVYNVQIFTSGSAEVRGVSSSLDGEAQAFMYALHNIWTKGRRYFWFEGANLELTNIINTHEQG